ncbi:MAG: recombinase family protein [Coriobacteriales bacterium]|jgi:DNA invertase Pin-like site-specific DNA recombinase|nr:recombinase family protein [Coriobacteriales bacterium]
MSIVELSYQRVKPARADNTSRTNIRTNILPFYTQEQQVQKHDEPVGITAIYTRLSQDDKLEGESNSIANQKRMLERYCKEHGYIPYRHYDKDDGYSGTNFNRPDFQRMLTDIKAGHITRVVVKDMSRFGRDYLQVGMFTDILFPDLGIRFIAVNDGVDSTRGDNEFTAIRNVFNEMYARDTSKKVLATVQSKGKSGEHLTTRAPYGYMKDPNDNKKWIIDEEAAAVVQKIFSLYTEGMGPSQIAKWLRAQRISCPPVRCTELGMKAPCRLPKDSCKWSTQAVSNILQRLEYLGHTVNFKTRKQSFKSKKYAINSPDEWLIFEDTQEPIIEESIFMIVQNIRQGHRRLTKTGEPPIFSGLVFCADCNSKLHFSRQKGTETGRFTCSAHKSGAAKCTAHYIRLDTLQEAILRDLREAIAYVSRYEKDFIREASEVSAQERDGELAKKKSELAKAERRTVELDTIIRHLYEDNVTGKLSDERFVKLSRDYEREQDELSATIKDTRTELKAREKKQTKVRDFIAVTKKYTDLKELDAAVLREFVEKIYVSEKDKATNEQELEIVYNFVGAFDFKAAKTRSERPKHTENMNAA